MLKRILSLTLAAVIALAVFATAAFAEAIDEGVIYFVYTENGKDLNVRNARQRAGIRQLTVPGSRTSR